MGVETKVKKAAKTKSGEKAVPKKKVSRVRKLLGPDELKVYEAKLLADYKPLKHCAEYVIPGTLFNRNEAGDDHLHNKRTVEVRCQHVDFVEKDGEKVAVQCEVRRRVATSDLHQSYFCPVHLAEKRAQRRRDLRKKAKKAAKLAAKVGS